LTFGFWLLTSLTLSRGFGHEVTDDLLKPLAATFWALCLICIVVFHAENDGKIFITFKTSILITWHPISLLSSSVTNCGLFRKNQKGIKKQK
jgi:hypothetical protein